MTTGRSIEQPIGLAVIGAGRIGSTRARVASAYPASRVVAIVDVNVDRAVELANEVGAELATDDVRRAVSSPGVDAVRQVVRLPLATAG